ncbi:MAG TPA: lanthionine synthetase LanC family protein [Kofleriaceae bacterium]|nr:lanthionine synthetase LanC family protein [Kofleriaceae bacterium]
MASKGEARGGMEGGVGRACLLAYAGQAHGDEGMIERGTELLDAAVASLNDERGVPGLWGGLADTRFMLAHVAAGDEADHGLGVIDDALLDTLGGTLRRRIDLIGGLAGIGLAALEDPARGRGTAIATRVLDMLEAAAEPDEHGVSWFTPAALLPEWQRERCPDGYWNLGLAHGIPGVIGCLAAMVTAGVEAARAHALLERAVPSLLAMAPPRAPARFPSWRGRGASDEPSRLAWCYGDAGVAVALLAAARALSRPAWETEVVAIARGMATRSFADSGVVDMAICHGAAGVAHIFNRLYQATGDEVVGDAARGWYRQLLAMRRPGEAVAGFPARNHVDGGDVWVADDGVLMGATGVGLVLLAAVTELEPSWDRALLCGVEPG